MKKYIPYSSVCIVQALTIFFFPIMIIVIVFHISDLLKIILSFCFGVFWLADIIVYILSFFIWWNKPIIVSKIGISIKGQKVHLWSDMSSIDSNIKFRTIYGSIIIVVITYIDNTKLSFELGDAINRSIRELCCDETFLKKYNEVIPLIY